MMRRYCLALMVLACGLVATSGWAGDDKVVAERMARVREIHGAVGPWAVAGYRMGERARKELGLPKYALTLRVVHRCPAQVQYSCVADGLQAATGASPGKLNLLVEEATAEKMRTIIRDDKSGRVLTFTLKPEFVQSITNLPHDRLETEGKRVAGLCDNAIFSVAE
jgi:formylmethanofuran dehydrogenase subunit E